VFSMRNARKRVQFDIGGELASMAVRAQVVGTRYFHPAHSREDRLGAQFPIVSLVAARARNRALVGRRSRELQQFGQRRGAGLVHGRAHRHLDGFQIQTPGLAALLENDTQ